MQTKWEATPETVGDWGGKEAQAAHKFNLIVKELGKFDPPLTDDEWADWTHHAWDCWGWDEELLRLTPKRAKEWVEANRYE